MVNQRLRAAVSAAGLTYERLAAELDVSPKTVERWISTGRVPYPRHRAGLVARLDRTELHLWPELAATDGYVTSDDGIGTNELVRVHPNRAAVPAALWIRLIDSAADRIDLLLDAEHLLLDDVPDLADRLVVRAQAGTRVRLLLPDPSSWASAVQADEAGSAPAAALAAYQPLAGAPRPNVDVQFHRTTLYTSIHQFDDELLVSPHVYGVGAGQAPVLHLSGAPHGPLFETYIMNFERVWQSATPTWPTIQAA